ncbi:cold-shock protein [Streptomyces sp. 7-21]|uniref:cold-shock protein n=1 Tax=Streptomyces sp. 7-21 TaxID=2802283 RepID=UPI001F2A18C7|nr:cold shock domain-containing protein [Streptomyces sp. 7-21]
MATGRILQFDEMRGFGFIGADDGGEDVFLHTSVFDGDPSDLVPGARVEFQVMAGGRGRKAFAAHLLDEETTKAEVPVPVHRREPDTADSAAASSEETGMCDVLSQGEFRSEVTELLLEAVPSLTGGQLVEIRHSLLDFAKKRGWVDT